MSEAKINEASWPVPDESKPAWLNLVSDQVASLPFGTVLINVHNGRLVQVEKNEKLRLDQTTSTPARLNQTG
jgi:hypothetical protein